MYAQRDLRGRNALCDVCDGVLDAIQSGTRGVGIEENREQF